MFPVVRIPHAEVYHPDKILNDRDRVQGDEGRLGMKTGGTVGLVRSLPRTVPTPRIRPLQGRWPDASGASGSDSTQGERRLARTSCVCWSDARAATRGTGSPVDAEYGLAGSGGSTKRRRQRGGRRQPNAGAGCPIGCHPCPGCW
jgi:hypothetical protein